MSAGGDLRQLDYPKVFANGSYVLGVAGYLGDSQLLRATELPEVDTWDIDKWVTKVLLKKLKKMKGWVDPDGFDSHLLIDIAGRLYDLNGTDSWARYNDGIYTAGTGGKLAHGAVLAGASLADAVEFAGRIDAYTSGPYRNATTVELVQAVEND